MSIDSTKSFEQQIAEASTPAQLREICINHEVAQGALTQDRDGTVHPVVEPVPAGLPAPAVPAVRADHLRERVIYPFQNVRVTITGTTEEEITEAEKTIRAAYAQSA